MASRNSPASHGRGSPQPRAKVAADGRRPLGRGNTALLEKRHCGQDERLGVAPRLLQQLGVGVLGMAVLDGEVRHGCSDDIVFLGWRAFGEA